MVTLDDVAQLCAALPEVAEGVSRGHRSWSVAGKTFAWERPFSMADLKRFGKETPPDGPILAVRVQDLEEKAAVLAAAQQGFFTISHFDGYPAVLVQLSKASKKSVRDAVLDGWLACAPAKLSQPYLQTSSADIDEP